MWCSPVKLIIDGMEGDEGRKSQIEFVVRPQSMLVFRPFLPPLKTLSEQTLYRANMAKQCCKCTHVYDFEFGLVHLQYGSGSGKSMERSFNC